MLREWREKPWKHPHAPNHTAFYSCVCVCKADHVLYSLCSSPHAPNESNQKLPESKSLLRVPALSYSPNVSVYAWSFSLSLSPYPSLSLYIYISLSIPYSPTNRATNRETHPLALLQSYMHNFHSTPSIHPSIRTVYIAHIHSHD